MPRVVFYYFKGNTDLVSGLPEGEGVDVLLADQWDDLHSLLADQDFSPDMVILNSVPAGEKVDFVRRIKRIKNVPVIFFEELSERQKKELERLSPPLVDLTQSSAGPAKKRLRPPANDPIETARRFMEDNFQAALSLDAIARRSGLSPSYFCRRFKEKYGKSPVNYIRSVRLNRALYLLSNTDLPLTDVARQSGFYSVSYFCREFKKALGQTPMAYRRDLKTKRS